jgi:hypothetical protein
VNEQLVLSVLSTVFGKLDITIDNGSIIWSEHDSNPESKYDTLYTLEPFLNGMGYTVMGQDDNEFFGAQLDLI